MSRTPSQRKGADRPTKHHLFNRDFAKASGHHLAVRHNTTYQVGIRRDHHDRLHIIQNHIAPVCIDLCKDLVDIGIAHQHRTDDLERLDWVIDDLTGVARHARPEKSDHALEVIFHIASTRGILEYINSTRSM